MLQEIKSKTPINKKQLRAKCINNDNFKTKGKQWVTNTPYDIRDEAMNDVIKAYASNFAKNAKNGNTNRFDVKFRSIRDNVQSIAILNKHWKRAGIFHPMAWTKEPIAAAELLPDKLNYDSRLVRDRLGRYYLCIPKPLDVVSESQGDMERKSKIIALDPGVRTFCTGYDPSGSVYEWGRGDISRIHRLCHAADKLQSKWDGKDIRHHQRYKYKRAAQRIRNKITNLVDEFHKKLALWSVQNYQVILLPHFETSNMVSRSKRRINSKSARAMLTWSHYRFKMRLISKAREWGTNIVLCDEHHTSKTCGECGFLHQKLGSSKIFNCPKCNQISDRDFNAARNILLRYLVKSREVISGVVSSNLES